MINVGIAGTGNISAAHVEGYLRFPDRCRIVALCDIVDGKAQRKAEEWGLTEVAIHDTVADLAADASVDLVSVCTPPGTHADIATTLLDEGKHVILEKPMAPSVAECERILEAQRRSGTLLSVVAQNRFRDDMATLKTALDSGLTGPVTHVRVDSSWWRGLPYYDLSWRGTWESEGGGPTLNHAIHHIDLLLWLLGEPASVMAMMTNAAHENAEVEDLSVAVLQYERALAQLTSSVVHHGEEQHIVIQGRDASIAQPWVVRAESPQPNGFPLQGGNAELVEQVQRLVDSREPLAHQGHTGQIDDVLTALEQGTEPLVTGVDGRRAVEVVTAIYQAAIEQRLVPLPLAPEDPYFAGQGLMANAPRYYRKSTSVDEQAGFITVGGSGRQS